MEGSPRGDYWSPERNDSVRCRLCPRRCLIGAGSSGFCRVRINVRGELVLPYWGRISALAVDPVEKKPLYHFHPGGEILSVGFFGCNLGCPFCQNWTISREFGPGEGRFLTPERLIAEAVATGIPLIAFTYSEPLVHTEYLVEALRRAREAGLGTALVTNGMIEPEPARDILPLTDALNIDLKSFNPGYYHRILKGDLEAVKRFVARAAETSHVEITTLLVPGDNDGERELEAAARFIASLSSRIPWHLSAYRPEYRYRKPATTSETVRAAVEIGRRHLSFVYTGNLSGENDTRCPTCSKLLVERNGYSIGNRGWDAGNCRFCGERVGGR